MYAHICNNIIYPFENSTLALSDIAPSSPNPLKETLERSVSMMTVLKTPSYSIIHHHPPQKVAAQRQVPDLLPSDMDANFTYGCPSTHKVCGFGTICTCLSKEKSYNFYNKKMNECV